MRTEIPLLHNVRVASPCPASWEAMESVDDDRVRFCEACQKRVYNLSAMSQAEAEGLLRRHEGRLCVRYYRRNDGTILTTDCPVGLRAARRMVLTRTRASAALCALLCLAFASWRAPLTTPASQPTAGVPSFTEPDKVHEAPTMGTPIPAPPPPFHAEGHRIGRILRPPHVHADDFRLQEFQGAVALPEASRGHHEKADAQKLEQKQTTNHE
jgi:hypothetical protein